MINTCSVTENADKKCKQLVRRAHKINPEVYVAIIGCYAQLKPTEIAQIPGVSLVLGANEKFNIVEHLEALENEKQNENQKDHEVTEAVVKFEHIKQTTSFIPSHSMGDRTRSFLKVQDGCDYFCSFCTIPLAR